MSWTPNVLGFPRRPRKLKKRLLRTRVRPMARISETDARLCLEEFRRSYPQLVALFPQS